jgi:hypothetical protein
LQGETVHFNLGRKPKPESYRLFDVGDNLYLVPDIAAEHFERAENEKHRMYDASLIIEKATGEVVKSRFTQTTV